MGTFPGQKYCINVDPIIEPKRTAPRPVPVHQQAQFKEELNKKLKLEVIKPVYEATPWISSFVMIEMSKDTKQQDWCTGSTSKYKDESLFGPIKS